MQDGTFKGSCPRGWTRGSPTSTGMPKGSHSQSPAEEGGCEHRPFKRRDDRDRRDRVSRPRGAFARRTDQKRRPSSRSAPTSSFLVQHGTRSCPFRWGSSDPIPSQGTSPHRKRPRDRPLPRRSPPRPSARGLPPWEGRKSMYLWVLERLGWYPNVTPP